MNENKQEKILKIAQDIILLSRNTLIVNMRFLDSAISMLEYVPYKAVDSTATDGKHIFYSPGHIIRLYRKSKEVVTRNILHIILHNVFRHNIIGTLLNREAWDLACDIAVEVIINELQLPILAAEREKYQHKILDQVRDNVKFMTAEKIYNYLISDVPAEKIHEWAVYFRADDHTNWYETVPDITEALRQCGKVSNNAFSSEISSETLVQEWKTVAEKMQMDIEAFSSRHGNTPGSLIQNLNAINREKYDYTNFLKRFAVMGEAMKINEDEFDYIFYTYGMKLYDRMPLIEPLEYKDVKRIKEFVIAIDTSGSVSGDLVQKFVQKTYNILKQEEGFFTKINLHIIQCDTIIQEDVKITCQEDFDHYLETMTLKGFGGTDFRPVFRYVDEMIKNKEFTNLKGLIYFTDGYGDFPSHQPDYNTAFVFIDDEYNNPDVPAWAIKLILQPDEI